MRWLALLLAVQIPAEVGATSPVMVQGRTNQTTADFIEAVSTRNVSKLAQLLAEDVQVERDDGYILRGRESSMLYLAPDPSEAGWLFRHPEGDVRSFAIANGLYDRVFLFVMLNGDRKQGPAGGGFIQMGAVLSVKDGLIFNIRFTH